MSNSPDPSPLSSPDVRSEDIVFSARPSPGLTIDNPQSPRSPQRYLRNSSTLSSPRSTSADEASGLSRPTPPPRSQPIAIELPPPKKTSNSAPVYTPPAPLSARGDLPGGYFPLHEEQNRVYRPHPFELDATKARMKSIQRASKESPPNPENSDHPIGKGDIGPATTNVPPAKADRAMEIPRLHLNSLGQGRSASTLNTPVASYMPLGDQASPLPMGKYYPSNYEKRKGEKRKKGKNHRPANSGPTMATSAKSEPQVPVINQNSAMGHTRTESEAKYRLQQYQRDMIAQATIALNRGNANEAALSSIRSLGFSNVMKPSKPRLIPLGSPGPVTPMELEGSHDGYLDVHDGTAIAQAELGRVVNSEEQNRQENSASPVVELGPSTL
ncbi:hypothetical protein GGR55DRAFT_690504 [Xylaria sp. FL0064]|nr:hypothetical protein GGR55DRAFT_690504 [Xylaria sp. FL0064]